MLESLDEVRIGEYLMCARGPWVTGTDPRGRVIGRIDRSFEGTVVLVRAVSPPMMLMQVHPMPCGDPTHDHSPYPALIRWDYMGWTRPTRRYVREYMKAARLKPPRPALPAKQPGAVTHKEMEQMLNEVYQKGGNPEWLGSPEDLFGRDDDDDYTPVD